MKGRLHGAFCVHVLCLRIGGMRNDLQEQNGTQRKENASVTVTRPGLKSQA